MNKRYVPLEKMGKKARKALNAEKRTVWTVKPITKVVSDKKKYDRKRDSRRWLDADSGSSFLSL